MKTIQQQIKLNLAKKYFAKSNNPKKDIDRKTDYETGFYDGVEFAQRWISVKERLPEKQGHYLVIAPQSFPKNCKVVVAEFDEDAEMFYSESSDCPIYDASDWRPIELE